MGGSLKSFSLSSLVCCSELAEGAEDALALFDAEAEGVAGSEIEDVGWGFDLDETGSFELINFTAPVGPSVCILPCEWALKDDAGLLAREFTALLAPLLGLGAAAGAGSVDLADPCLFSCSWGLYFTP